MKQTKTPLSAGMHRRATSVTSVTGRSDTRGRTALADFFRCIAVIIMLCMGTVTASAEDETLLTSTYTSSNVWGTTAISAGSGTIQVSKAESSYTSCSSYFSHSHDGTCYGYKLDGNSKYILLTLADGTTLQEGDVLTFEAYSTSSGGGLYLDPSSSSGASSYDATSTITTKNTGTTLTVTIGSDSKLKDSGTVYVYRNGTSTYVHSVTITRSSSSTETSSTFTYSSVSPVAGTVESVPSLFTLTYGTEKPTVATNEEGSTSYTPTLTFGETTYSGALTVNDLTTDDSKYTVTVTFSDITGTGLTTAGTYTLAIPAGALTYTSNETTYTSEAVSLTYTISESTTDDDSSDGGTTDDTTEDTSTSDGLGGSTITEDVCSWNFETLSNKTGSVSASTTEATVSDCSLKWKVNGTSDSNYIEIDSKKYYKVSDSSSQGYVTITTSSDNALKEDDVVNIYVTTNSSKTEAVDIFTIGTNTISTTYTANEATTVSYTLQSGDISSDEESGTTSVTFTGASGNTNLRLYGMTITRSTTITGVQLTASSNLEDNTAQIGQTVTLTSTLYNVTDDSRTYQWYSTTTDITATESLSSDNGTVISDATAYNYSFTPTAAGTVYYYAIVTYTADGESSTVASDVITVTTVAPTISIPSTVTAYTGQETTITATVENADYISPTYQWYSKTSADATESTAVSDATTTTLTITPTGATTLYYSITMSATVSETSQSYSSETATVTVKLVSPTITNDNTLTITTDDDNVQTVTVPVTITTTDDGSSLSCSTTATLSTIDGATTYYIVSTEKKTYDASDSDWKKYETSTDDDGTTGYPSISIDALSATQYLTAVYVYSDNSTAYSYAIYERSFSAGTITLSSSAGKSVAVNGTLDLAVKATYTVDDSSVDVTDYVTLSYTSSKTSVATVENGTVTGVSTGTATITVSGTADGATIDDLELAIVVADLATPTIKVYSGESTDSSNLLTKDDGDYDEDVYTLESNVSTVTVEITAGDTYSSDDYTLLYTCDGLRPGLSDNTQTYSSTFTLTGTTYIHARLRQTVTESGSTYYKYSESAVAVVQFADTYRQKFDEGYDPVDGEATYITNGKTGEDSVAYVIMTWGSAGDDDELWTAASYDKGTVMKSSELADYEYYVKGEEDAKGETYTNASDPENYYYPGDSKELGKYSTFDAPIQGSYIKIEPLMDGEMELIVRQNGIIANTPPDITKMRRRKVYVCNEQGEPLTSLFATINPNALQQDSIFLFQTTSFTTDVDSSENNLAFYQKLAYYSYHKELDDDSNLPSMSDDWSTKTMSDGTTTYASAAATFWAYDDDQGKGKLTHNVLYKDGRGWLTLSKAYVRYSFPVMAGKTYFLAGYYTKIGVLGLTFSPKYTEAEYNALVNTNTYTIDGTNTSSVSLPEAKKFTTTAGSDGTYTATESTGEDAVYAPATVTVTRTFTAGAWTSLVLPFSVSPTKLINVFGEGTEIIHYDGLTSNDSYYTLNLKKHWHQMIVAGTPMFIKPKNTVENPKFEGVVYGIPTVTATQSATDGSISWSISSVDISTITNEDKSYTDGDSDYELKASYTPTTVSANHYLLGFKSTTDDEGNTTVSENNFYLYTTEHTIPGTRAWLEAVSTTAAPLQSVIFDGVEDMDDSSETTGIINAVLTGDSSTGNMTYDGNIYNVNGQLVRPATQGTDNLPKGVYIVKGKKVVVK